MRCSFNAPFIERAVLLFEAAVEQIFGILGFV
jgi:hypothetical protein